MRSVVVTQSELELDSATEAFLFSALAGLERHCDSLRSCRVHVEAGRGSSGGRKPLSVRLLLNTGEHQIKVISLDWTNNCLTARDAIRTAIHQAESELRELKLTNKCATCCDQEVA